MLRHEQLWCECDFLMHMPACSCFGRCLSMKGLIHWSYSPYVSNAVAFYFLRTVRSDSKSHAQQHSGDTECSHHFWWRSANWDHPAVMSLNWIMTRLPHSHMERSGRAVQNIKWATCGTIVCQWQGSTYSTLGHISCGRVSISLIIMWWLYTSHFMSSMLIWIFY